MRRVSPAGFALAKIVDSDGTGNPNYSSATSNEIVTGDEAEEKTEARDADCQVRSPIRLAPPRLEDMQDSLGVTYQPRLEDMQDALHAEPHRRYSTMPQVDSFVETEMLKDQPEGSRHCGENDIDTLEDISENEEKSRCEGQA